MKALKAAIYARGADQVWGHSVGTLCENIASMDPGQSTVASGRQAGAALSCEPWPMFFSS